MECGARGHVPVGVLRRSSGSRAGLALQLAVGREVGAGAVDTSSGSDFDSETSGPLAVTHDMAGLYVKGADFEGLYVYWMLQVQGCFFGPGACWRQEACDIR